MYVGICYNYLHNTVVV